MKHPTLQRPATPARVAAVVLFLLALPPCGRGLRSEESPAPTPGPLTPAETLRATHIREGFVAEIVAAEPLVLDPVAIDWGPDGRLWVAEMADYPSGMPTTDSAGAQQKASGAEPGAEPSEGLPGGRVRFLADTDGNGDYDHSVVFLEGIRFPTGVTAWKQGVIVTAAPEIFYAADTDGDGKADHREVLFSGFLEGNQQLRVNGLRWGLDNWLYCASGGHAASYVKDTVVRSHRTQTEIPLGSRDFRFSPSDGHLVPCSGPSQFGRVRDDWGNWFGVQNSHPLWHYVLSDRHVRRNPYAPAPDPRHHVRFPSNPKVFPAKAPQKRFHSFRQSGRFTSACGPSIYRDELLFDRQKMHAFTCEPFHNVVQHSVLQPDGATFEGSRATEDGELDFFASKDRWCRPVMTRTGPDGALWIVDMYRYVIEHPRWLPPAGREAVRPYLRSGEDRGRIYRVYRRDRPPRRMEPLGPLPTATLVERLAAPNGSTRDLAQRLLVERLDAAAHEPLTTMAKSHPLALARLHALSTLAGSGLLSREVLDVALRDSDSRVVRHTLRLAEDQGEGAAIVAAASELVDSPAKKVRLTLAGGLGASPTARAGDALGRLAIANFEDRWIRATVIGSMPVHLGALTEALLQAGGGPLESYFKVLAATAIGMKRETELARLVDLAVSDLSGNEPTFQHFGQLLDAFEAQGVTLTDLKKGAGSRLSAALAPTSEIFVAARIAAAGSTVSESRLRAIALLGRDLPRQREDVLQLAKLLPAQTPTAVRAAAVRALARVRSDAALEAIVGAWPSLTPEVRRTAAEGLLTAGDAGPRAIVDAIREQKIRATSLTVTERQRLLRHRNEEIRAAAKRWLDTPVDADREAVVEKFKGALEGTRSLENGLHLFGKLCRTCHPTDGKTPLVGPDLRSITDRSGEGLLLSILDPSRSVDPRYLGYLAVLQNGETIYGIIVGETGNSLIFRLPDASERSILRSRIATLEQTGLSLMPNGLEAELSKKDVGDLVEYVKSLAPK